MASTSSSVSNSLHCPRWKYHVFLSFRGEDTRRTFTGHLYEGVKNRGIFTFQDDKRLEHGDSIPEELLKAIEESQVALIVFSKNYATSKWCLNELVKIMECKEKNGQIVIPIFYDVDPSEVRNQRESFAEAFAKLESNYKDDVEGMQKVQGWRAALTTAANLKGHDIRDKIESEHIQHIVDDISSKLCKSAYSLSSFQEIVGINDHLEKLKSLLQIEINDVRIVGIWGIGGVGKTTIAKAIFDTLAYQFKAACFLADVKENATKNQLHSLQNTLLSELLRKEYGYVKNKYDGKSMIPSRLCSMKVLIVLDDIDHSDHLEYLAGDLSWFGIGSRVIVTTRNRHLIGKDDAIHEVPTLPHHEAMQLFNQHAFKKEVPDERFKLFSLEVVNHAKGLPLALKVWGSLLHKKDLNQWRRTVDQIKINSSSEIVDKLKISYDGLEPEEQKIFLDMACFFRGHEKEEVMQILKSCDFGAEYGLDVLIDKSLVFISEYDRIEMHDLIQDMGRYVVKMQKDSGELSRIWDAKDFEEVMLNNTGTNTEAIWLEGTHNLCFSKKALKNMKRLRVLYIRHFGTFDDFIEYLPNNLRFFGFCGYPRESLPENFEPKRLVHLDLRFSLLCHLWIGTKHFPSLRRLDLGFSQYLRRTPDFTGMPNLEYLDLEGCTSLGEVHPSLKCCKKLIRLNLSGCFRLERFPYVNVESLEYLDLRRCSSLEKFPELPLSIIQHQAHHTELHLNGMENLELSDLPSLRSLHLGFSQYLRRTPDFTGMPNLEYLDLRWCESLEEVHPSLKCCGKLIRLNLFNCKRLERFPYVNVESLEYLNLKHCSSLEKIPEFLLRMKPELSIWMEGSRIMEIPPSIFQPQTYLTELHLTEMQDLVSLPSSICKLKRLVKLDVSYCSKLESLPEEIGDLENLEELHASNTLISRPPPSIVRLNKLKFLDFEKKNSEDGVLFVFPQVNEGLRSLEYLNLSFCNLIDGGLPEDIGCLSSLEELDLGGNDFEHLPRSIVQLGALRSLNLEDCKRLKQLPEFPEQLDTIYADWSNDWICNSLFQNISSLQHDVSASDSSSLRVFNSLLDRSENIPSWFHHQGTGTSVSLNLPENWYVSDNFLGFAVCYSDELLDITAHLIPLCDDGMSSMTQKFALSNHSDAFQAIQFFLVPFAGLWDTSKANGKTPNDYGRITLSFSGVMREFGLRLLYKDEPDDSEHHEEDSSTGIRRSRYDGSEHHEEASCSSSKKQRSQVEVPVSSKTLQLFPTSPGF